jgi:RimJ/RimL family protein N-acetyltransferase
MTKVWCVRELNNYDGKKKYSTDYHTSYTIGRIQLVDYTRDRASHTARRTIPHIEYELNEDFRNRGIMSKELPRYLKWLQKYEYNELISVVKNDDESAEYSKRLLIKNGFVKFELTTLEGYTTFLWHAKLHKELKRLIECERVESNT